MKGSMSGLMCLKPRTSTTLLPKSKSVNLVSHLVGARCVNGIGALRISDTVKEAVSIDSGNETAGTAFSFNDLLDSDSCSCVDFFDMMNRKLPFWLSLRKADNEGYCASSFGVA